MFVADFCLLDNKGAGTDQHTDAEQDIENVAEIIMQPVAACSTITFSDTDSDVIVRLGFGEACYRIVLYSSPRAVRQRRMETSNMKVLNHSV